MSSFHYEMWITFQKSLRIERTSSPALSKRIEDRRKLTKVCPALSRISILATRVQSMQTLQMHYDLSCYEFGWRVKLIRLRYSTTFSACLVLVFCYPPNRQSRWSTFNQAAAPASNNERTQRLIHHLRPAPATINPSDWLPLR